MPDSLLSAFAEGVGLCFIRFQVNNAPAASVNTSNRITDLNAEMQNPIISRIRTIKSAANAGEGGCLNVLMPGVWGFEKVAPSAFDCRLHEPVVCFVLQGSFSIRMNDEALHAKAGQFVVVSHTVPVDYRVNDATAATPYVALIVELDLDLVRAMRNKASLISHFTKADTDAPKAIAIGDTDERLQNAMNRLIESCGEKTEAEVIAPLVKQEIYWRVLMSNCGTLLTQLLTLDSNASQVAQSIEHIRENYREPISVKQLAKIASMSESSFHAHFRSITSHSPLQYIKEFRLLEGRRLMQRGDHDVGQAALSVGYESQSQFSREYSRRFGRPPSQEAATL